MGPGTRPSDAAPRVPPAGGTTRTMLGPIVLFGSGCFFVFGFIYLTLVGSAYMFLSNLAFGGLCALTWLGHRWRLTQPLMASVFLAVVYLGLVNVAVHLGDARSPMAFWGISVGIAAVFLFELKGQLVWFVLVLVFLPLVQALKAGPLAGRVIPLDATQVSVLTLATYLGLHPAGPPWIFRGRGLRRSPTVCRHGALDSPRGESPWHPIPSPTAWPAPP